MWSECWLLLLCSLFCLFHLKIYMIGKYMFLIILKYFSVHRTNCNCFAGSILPSWIESTHSCVYLARSQFKHLSGIFYWYLFEHCLHLVIEHIVNLLLFSYSVDNLLDIDSLRIPSFIQFGDQQCGTLNTSSLLQISFKLCSIALSTGRRVRILWTSPYKSRNDTNPKNDD